MRSTRFWNKLHRYHTEQNKRPRHVTLEIHVLVSDRHKTVARLNWLMGSQTYSLDNWSSNGNVYIKQLFCFWWWNVTMADRHDWDIQCHTHNITVWRAILLETQRTFSKDDKGVYLIWLTDSYFFLKISVGSKNINCSLPISSKLDKMFPWVMTGGRSIPEDCRARHHVAIIIPFRDRDNHLRTFLYNIHPFLRRQQLDYGIYIIEQVNNVYNINDAILNVVKISN